MCCDSVYDSSHLHSFHTCVFPSQHTSCPAESLHGGPAQDISHHLRLCPAVDQHSSEQRFTCIPRLNPLHPPLVLKRTVCLETPAVHHHNQQRTLLLQRREHYRLYHQVWQKPFYGSSIEREEYRKELREHLKRQIEEKYAALKLLLASKGKEAEYVKEVDRLALSSEREQMIQHRKAMTAYRDENKRLMEQSWRDRALTRSQEALKERELLCLNPINWSGTLK
uniref:Uncharacterized protein n=1 Tax=Labrus bergylta TaxID=56723 RepID=A0A3Q3EIW8_9LABR